MKNGFLLLCCLITGVSFSQKNAEPATAMIWLGYYNTVGLKPAWSVNTEMQHRTTNGFKTQAQSLLRLSLTYKTKKGIAFSGGLAHFRHYLTNRLSRGEWRPWQEAALATDFGNLKFTNRLRTEQRFNQLVYENALTHAYRFNWRFRYKTELDVALLRHNNKTYSLSASNELLLNAGKQISHVFDQNRAAVSLNGQVTSNVKLQLQFMYIVQHANTAGYNRFAVFRFNVFHTINFKHAARQ